MKMKINSILKSFLKKYYPTILIFILKNYFGLDFLNDFNPFSSETKEYFNGNNPQDSSINPPSEGEGSNRQYNNNDNNNNNTPNQDSNINPPSFEESPEIERQTEGMLDELIEDEEEPIEDEEEIIGDEDRAFRDEDARIMTQMQLREEIMSINKQALDEKSTEILRRMDELQNLKNQSESDESMIPVLVDMQHQLDKDIEALNQYSKTLEEEARASREEVKKLIRDREEKAAA
jgi:hypothetical protein